MAKHGTVPFCAVCRPSSSVINCRGSTASAFWLHRMRTIATYDPVAWYVYTCLQPVKAAALIEAQGTLCYNGGFDFSHEFYVAFVKLLWLVVDVGINTAGCRTALVATAANLVIWSNNKSGSSKFARLWRRDWLWDFADRPMTQCWQSLPRSI